jgi:CheY-like chemotaxis protein
MATARKKILCIEDDRESAALIAEELADRDFEVDIAHNGQEGFVAILKDKPDLVLCDMSMPIMSGFEVLERLTEIAPRPWAHAVRVPHRADRSGQRARGTATRCRRLRD